MTSAMMTKLRDAAVYSEILVEKAFQTEIFGIPQSLAKDQFSLYHGTKSTILIARNQMSQQKRVGSS